MKLELNLKIRLANDSVLKKCTQVLVYLLNVILIQNLALSVCKVGQRSTTARRGFSRSKLRQMSCGWLCQRVSLPPNF